MGKRKKKNIGAGEGIINKKSYRTDIDVTDWWVNKETGEGVIVIRRGRGKYEICGTFEDFDKTYPHRKEDFFMNEETHQTHPLAECEIFYGRYEEARKKAWRLFKRHAAP